LRMTGRSAIAEGVALVSISVVDWSGFASVIRRSSCYLALSIC
jgi:hypothetical protein